MPPVQRAAAEALGRLGDRTAVADLLALAGSRARPHARTLGDIRPHRNRATHRRPAPDCRPASSRAKRAALIALDQMDGGGLKAEAVIPLLDSSDPPPEGHGLVDRRSSPGVGQCAGRVFPGTPGRHQPDQCRARRVCSRSSSSSRRTRRSRISWRPRRARQRSAGRARMPWPGRGRRSYLPAGSRRSCARSMAASSRSGAARSGWRARPRRPKTRRLTCTRRFCASRATARRRSMSVSMRWPRSARA